MKLVLRFDFYSVEELSKIVQHRSKALGWHLEEALLPLIAQRCERHSTSRSAAAAILLECLPCQRWRRTLPYATWRWRAPWNTWTSWGSDPLSRSTCRSLAEGANRLNVLASMLGLPSRTLSSVTEPFLIRAGLVVKDDGGKRQLTAAGREHLFKACPGRCANSVQMMSHEHREKSNFGRGDGSDGRAEPDQVLPVGGVRFSLPRL